MSNEKKISESGKKRFAKEFALPIVTFKEEHFQYFLDLYEKQFKSMTKYKELLKEIEKYGSIIKIVKKR
jgi:hypothetical protein